MDNKTRKSFNAAVWYIISSFISKALLYIFTPLYTRLLTTSEYGQYNNFLSWQNILVTLLTFDLAAAITIVYYDYKEEDFNGFVNTISIFSYIIPGIFCIIIFLFRNQFIDIFSMQKKYLVLLLVYITFNNTLNIFQTEQRVRLKYKLSSILTLGTSILTVVTTLLFAITFQDKLFGILLGGVIINVFFSFLLAIIIWRKSRIVKFNYLKYALVLAVPLVPHILAGTILGVSDKIMITRYCGEEMTALYSLAYTISLIITMIASSINKAWTPWFFDRLKYNVHENIKKVSNFIVGSIAVISFGVCLLAPEIMLVIGGRPYVIGAVVMPPVIIACLVNCVSTFYINVEFYNKKTIGISVSTVISAGTNVLLNFIFVKSFGYIAAAYTTLFCALLNLIFHIYKVNQQHMLDVFDNKFLLGITTFTAIICESFILLYKINIIRYIIVALIFCAIIFIAIKFRKSITIIFNNLSPYKKTRK